MYGWMYSAQCQVYDIPFGQIEWTKSSSIAEMLIITASFLGVFLRQSDYMALQMCIISIAAVHARLSTLLEVGSVDHYCDLFSMKLSTRKQSCFSHPINLSCQNKRSCDYLISKLVDIFCQNKHSIMHWTGWYLVAFSVIVMDIAKGSTIVLHVGKTLGLW